MNDQATMFLRDAPELSAAREMDVDEIDLFRGIAAAAEAGRVSALAFAYVLVDAIKGGSDREKTRRALRSLGQITGALVVFFGARRTPESCGRLHSSIRKLDDDALDAFEDLLRSSRSALMIVEAERLWRAGVLTEDWCVEQFAPDRYRVRVPMGRVADA